MTLSRLRLEVFLSFSGNAPAASFKAAAYNVTPLFMFWCNAACWSESASRIRFCGSLLKNSESLKINEKNSFRLSIFTPDGTSFSIATLSVAMWAAVSTAVWISCTSAVIPAFAKSSTVSIIIAALFIKVWSGTFNALVRNSFMVRKSFIWSFWGLTIISCIIENLFAGRSMVGSRLFDFRSQS